ncbi:predicted protein [Lichtheimia corymbifera JMRC:FSU:9682]|uniref:Uncharacterized protein n=1 Tax=Lichtheimia corymbifera JMRC:FSU:9682 TaxID=1263082 RepID=A0A068SJ07_9FUNG|nr:predicted protein [Lichtheimia corymbifera JMRC:FSU:9682]
MHWVNSNLRTAAPRLDTTRLFSFSILCFYPIHDIPDRGIVKRVQMLRNERGCHGDIVAASCSLLLPLYAWCQQRATLVSRRWLIWRFVSAQQHHTMVFRFPVTNIKGSLCIRKRQVQWDKQ